MAPNADFSIEFNLSYLVQNVAVEDVVIDCKVCDEEFETSEALMAHIEICAKDSNVPYYVKMTVLHESKMEECANLVKLRYTDLCCDKPILLPKGVCFLCNNPEDHKNGKCQTVNRNRYFMAIVHKTNMDYYWHFAHVRRYLKKAEIEMLELKQRINLKALYEKIELEKNDTDGGTPIPENATEYPNTIGYEIRGIELENQRAVESLERDLTRKQNQWFSMVSEERTNLYMDWLYGLQAKDKEDPVKQLTFI